MTYLATFRAVRPAARSVAAMLLFALIATPQLRAESYGAYAVSPGPYEIRLPASLSEVHPASAELHEMIRQNELADPYGAYDDQAAATPENPFRFVQQPTQPIDPRTALNVPSINIFESAGAGIDVSGGERIDFNSPQKSAPPNDVGKELADTSGGDVVRAQRRSPVSFDPRIRGYRSGQIYSQADGALWRPAREDLDSVLSKLPPYLVAGAQVVYGPYAVRYGPGLAFIDVLTRDTPRYDCGYESHLTIGSSLRTNGDQWYNYASIEGGTDRSGYRIGYGNRTGIDYQAGNGEYVPSSYLSQDFNAQFGYDLNPFQTLEFRFGHVSQGDTEYQGKFFDMRRLTTDSFNLRLVDEDPSGPWSRLTLESWYNRTDFDGGTEVSPPGKANTIGRVERALDRALAGSLVDLQGTTFGDLTSTGARSTFTFGDVEAAHLLAGADFRYLSQRTEERFAATSADGPTNADLIAAELDDFRTNQPRGSMIDPGAFLELHIPTCSYWTMTTGARVDWVRTDADEADLRRDGSGNLVSSLPGAGADLARNDILYAFFLSNELQLDRNWTANLDFGHSQRPPTLTERYADGIFLGIFQNGFSRVIGNSNLKPERVWQVDLGLEAEYDCFRGGARGFYSWIIDYNTYEVVIISDPLGAQLVRGATSKNATLAGFEVYGEADLTSMLSVVASASYVDGRDRDLDVPLTGIYPLEGKVGLRLHDSCGGETWGLEFAGRIVDDQHRLAGLRNASGIGVQTVESPTPGFTVWNLRGYWMATRSLRLIGGVENVFDRNYLEHLDLRLPEDLGGAGTADDFAALNLYAPGVTPYVGAEWNY